MRGRTRHPLTPTRLAAILAEVQEHFRTFGGGRDSEWNPVARAIKDGPPQFAAGVDVADVIRFVVKELKR